LSQRAPRRDIDSAVLQPPDNAIGTDVYEQANDATSGIANDRSKSLGPGFIGRKVDPVNPENFDPWVYKQTKENSGVYPEWHLADTVDSSKLAASQKSHHHRKHKRPDIAERGMDEEVHGFVADSLPPLNTRERSNLPFIPNGSDASAFKGAALGESKHHHGKNKKDIGERGYDEEV